MDLKAAVSGQRCLYIKQKKNWAEIMVDFETANRYAVMDESQNIVGMIAEEGNGFLTTLSRLFFRSHRGFTASLVSSDGACLISLSRRFFFFFSHLQVTSGPKIIGHVARRFGILHKKYDLSDATGRVFATIKSPIWRLWTFPILDERRIVQGAQIAKKWGGPLREIFTDADTYQVDFGQGTFSLQERYVIIAAAISIDFDFFERNNRS